MSDLQNSSSVKFAILQAKTEIRVLYAVHAVA
jgi:hypothetical protein